MKILQMNNSIQSMHTIVMYHNNTKFIPNTCKNKQCTQELSENSQTKEMMSHSFMLEIKMNSHLRRNKK
jgi:hypothetical protein